MVISVGGAYVRVWRPQEGLAAEVPACVVLDSEGRIEALGEEAAAMEGKTPEHLHFLRPFLADRIVQREALRAILAAAIDNAGRTGRGTPWDRLSIHLAAGPSLPVLHREWLIRTLRETGVGWVRVVDPWMSLAVSQTKRSKGTPVMGVLDWGFSGVRAAVYAGNVLVGKGEAHHWSVVELCRRVREAEEQKTGRIFPLTELYNLQWGLSRTGFDSREGKPVVGALQKMVVQSVQAEFQRAVGEVLATVQGNLTAEQRSFLQSHGWTVVGGGAGLADLPGWETRLGVPVRSPAGPVYAALQGIGA